MIEGVISVKKDSVLDKHSNDLPIRNLEVMKLLLSFHSRGFVTSTYNWSYYYYILTDEGIKYLREYLGLPEDIVPATLKKPATIPTTRVPPRRFDGEDRRKSGPGGYERRGAREGYRPKQSS